MENNAVLMSAPGDLDTMLEGYQWMFNGRPEEAMAERLRLALPRMPENAEERIKPLNIFTERLLACLVSVVQSEFADVKFKNGIVVQPSERFRNYVDVMVPVRALLPSDDDHNYRYAAQAAAKLQSVVIPFEYGTKIKFKSMIVEAEADGDRGGHLLFSVSPEIWHLILNCSKGYRKTEFWVVRSLRNRLSYRFYKLVAGQKSPLVVRIDDIVNNFFISKSSSSKPSYFRSRVLDVVKKELDAVSPWSFDYELLQSREMRLRKKRGNPDYDLLKLYPLHVIRNERSGEYLTSAVPGHSVMSLMDPRLKEHLIRKFDMTPKQIESWRDMLLEADSRIPGGLYAFVLDRTEEIDRNARNRVAYLHEVIRNELERCSVCAG